VGRYDLYKTPMENIGLQDSLPSRFDLLFIMLDTVDVDSDRKISDHVVRMHRYRSPNEQDGDVLSIAADADVLTTKDLDAADGEEETAIWEKYDALLHGSSRKKTDKIVSVEFMSKYIHIAKCIKPVLTEEASRMIAEEYQDLRSADNENKDTARTQPVTARALETLIRLSTAHAKARLSKVIESQDAETAIELVQFAYFKKIQEKKKRRRASSDDEAEEEDRITPRKKQRKGDVSSQDSTTTDIAMEEGEQSLLDVPATATPVEINNDRYKHFMATLNKCFAEKDQAQSLEMGTVKDFFKKAEKKDPFSENEISACIEKMADENKVMLADQTLFMI